jgi:hypothetical protein
MRFGQNRYRVGTPTPDHPAFEALVRRGLVEEMTVADTSETSAAEFVILGDDGAAGDILRRLIEAHVRVSSFERAPLPLSSLIERIVTTHELQSKASDA